METKSKSKKRYLLIISFFLMVILGYFYFTYFDKEISGERCIKMNGKIVNNLLGQGCDSDCKNIGIIGRDFFTGNQLKCPCICCVKKDANNNKIIKEYPIEVTYPDNEDSPWAYETMYFDNNGERFSITQEGKVNKSDGSLFFNLGNESFIERLFIYLIKDNVITISQETDQDSGWGVVKRISTSTNKIIWSTDIPGFNLGTPIIVDNNLYISAIGFIGKLNLDTGQYIWKFENLYEDGKYNSFNEPTFNEDKVIYSTVIYRPGGQVNTIVIDDKKGQIISKD